MNAEAPAHTPVVTRIGDRPTHWWPALRALLQRWGQQLVAVDDGQAIPGSFWGESEAGLIAHHLYARADTPIHSVLHEACHYICMSPARRARLHTDAGGRDPVEENATCYLQCVLADHLPGYSRARMFADMDAWGYSFRTGSAQSWFEQDAEEALARLQAWALVDARQQPTFRLRQAPDPG